MKWNRGWVKSPARTWGMSAPAVAVTVLLGLAMVAVPGRAQQAAPNPTRAAAAGRASGRRGMFRPLYPLLPIGSPAPNFDLPGVDGKMHTLAEYSKAKILAIVFECDHCPESQLYEGRIRAIAHDYRSQGLQLIAINPNNPNSIELNELGYTDVTDSLQDMKIRAAYRHFAWPYLYDGATQTVAMKFGVVATPEIFIFDQSRHLRYEGRIDDNEQPLLVKSHDAVNALNAMLAGTPVPVTRTRAFGCSTKWLSKSNNVKAEMQKIEEEPVNLKPATPAVLKALRANNTGKIMVVDFWSTKCQQCLAGFHDLETTFRMYRLRQYDYTTVNTDTPADQAAVLKFLHSQYASSPNLQFASDNAKSLQAAFGAKWKLNQPFMMVIAPGGAIIYEKAGKLDTNTMRRAVLARMPDGRQYVGQLAYWQSKPGA